VYRYSARRVLWTTIWLLGYIVHQLKASNQFNWAHLLQPTFNSCIQSMHSQAHGSFIPPKDCAVSGRKSRSFLSKVTLRWNVDVPQNTLRFNCWYWVVYNIHIKYFEVCCRFSQFSILGCYSYLHLACVI
jgi:hypothetical protein